MVEKNRCEACEHFLDVGEGSQGRCHRFPPQVISQGGFPLSCWPKVQVDGYCWEWRKIDG